jgi:hypothetical protein
MAIVILRQILTKVLKLARYWLVESLQFPAASQSICTRLLFEGFVMEVGTTNSF